MTGYERVGRVHVTDGVTIEVTTYGIPSDAVELVVTSVWTAWAGTDREAVRLDRLELPYGVTVDELAATGRALVALADAVRLGAFA